jgi:hypothetical protein
MPVSSLNDDIEQQIDWWRWQGFRPHEAWDALGGSGLFLVVTWDDVRNLMRLFYATERKREAA